VALFGSVRDAWIADDLHGWLDANGIYAGLPDDLAAAQKQAELYIVTTKQVSTATSGQMHLAPGNTCMEYNLNSCKQIFIQAPRCWMVHVRSSQPGVCGVLCGVYALHVCSVQAK